MVADIEMADRPQDDSDYMEAVIQNMIDDGSQYFIDYHKIMQGNLSNKRAMRLSNNLSCNKKKILARYM